jgi:hypothetical protein
MFDAFTFDLFRAALKEIGKKLDSIDCTMEQHERLLERICDILTKDPEY